MFQVIYALCSLQLCIHKFQTLILGYRTELNVWHVWQTKLLYISVNAYSHLDLTISFESSRILPSEKLNTSYKVILVRVVVAHWEQGRNTPGRIGCQ